MPWGFVRKTTFVDVVFSASPIALAVTAPTSGNALIAVLATMDVVSATGAWTVSSVSDNGSPASTWRKAVAQPDTTHGANLEIWYATKVTGAPTSISFVVSGTGTSEQRGAVVLEYSGLADALVDQVASQVNGSGPNAPTGTTGTTAVNNELAIAAFSDSNQGQTITSPAGWTERWNNSLTAEDLTVAEKNVNIGTQTATFTMVGGPFGPAAIATFKPVPINTLARMRTMNRL